MLNTLFDQLAQAIVTARGIAIHEVGPMARDLGMTLIDESDGSDLNLEYWIEDHVTDERLVLEYFLLPVDEGEPLDQSFDLTLSRAGRIIRERQWHSVDGLMVEVEVVD